MDFVSKNDKLVSQDFNVDLSSIELNDVIFLSTELEKMIDNGQLKVHIKFKKGDLNLVQLKFQDGTVHDVFNREKDVELSSFLGRVTADDILETLSAVSPDKFNRAKSGITKAKDNTIASIDLK